jgi:hypothetical protein
VTNQTTSEQSKAVVDAYYQAGVRGRLTDFAPYLHPDFSTTAPNYLPWGVCMREQPSSAMKCCPICPTYSTSGGSATTFSLPRTSVRSRAGVPAGAVNAVPQAFALAHAAQSRCRRQHRHRGSCAFRTGQLYVDRGHQCDARHQPISVRRGALRCREGLRTDRPHRIVSGGHCREPVFSRELHCRRDCSREVRAEICGHRDAEHHGPHRVRTVEGAEPGAAFGCGGAPVDRRRRLSDKIP